MSLYEKIASAVIAVLLTAIVIASYHEFTEPRGGVHEKGPNFSQSLGQDFKMGSFVTVLNQTSSGGFEDDCQPLTSVIIGTLHDIDEHLEALDVYAPGVFEVNQSVLDLFCHRIASITLSNSKGEKLLLSKAPFSKEIPPGGSAADIGTDVRIDATVVLPGTVPPTTPTTYGEELIPDAYLDAGMH